MELELVKVLQAVGFPAWAVVVFVLGLMIIKKLSHITADLGDIRDRLSFVEGWVKRNGQAVEHLDYLMRRRVDDNG